jgi:hypothetical protein
VADKFPPTTQRAALKKLAAALDCSSTSLKTDECDDPQIVGKHGHVYATPDGFQLFVTTETARQWTAAKKALQFAEVANDGDTEGAFVLHRLPTPTEAKAIRSYLGIRQRRHLSDDARAALVGRLVACSRGV